MRQLVSPAPPAIFDKGMTPYLTVYDCTDEMVDFDFAPTDMAERETDLMLRLDVVFCGGCSLYEARQR
jgi:UDP-galactopyranose mutase